MECNKIFNMNEIISIVMEEVRSVQNKSIYAIEELDYPKNICDKMDKLNEFEFRDFMNNIEKIAEEILLIKSGELNELNKCHEEIMYLAGEYLENYLDE